MRPYLTIIFSILLFSNQTLAQNGKSKPLPSYQYASDPYFKKAWSTWNTAEIESLLKTQKNRNSGIYWAIMARWCESKNEAVQSTKHYRIAFELLNTQNTAVEKSVICNELGEYYYSIAQIDSSIYFFNQSLEAAKWSGKTELLAKAHYELASELYMATRVSEAIKHLYFSIESARKHQQHSYAALSFRLLSKIHKNQNSDNFYSLIDSALTYAKLSGDAYTTANVYSKLGEYYIEDQKFDLGRKVIKELKSIYLRDTSNHNLTIFYYEFLSRFFQEQGQYDSCIIFYNKTIQLSKTYDSYGGNIGWMYNNLGDVCLRANRFDEAIVYLDSAVVFGFRFDDLHLHWYAYYNQVIAYQGLKKYQKAADVFWKYNTVNDSILKQDNRNQINNLRIKYELENKELSIASLQKDNLLKSALIEQGKFRQKLYILLMLFGFLLAFLGVLAWRIKQRDNKNLRLQKDDIQNKSELLRQQAAEIAKFKTQMNPHFIFNAINSAQQFIVGQRTDTALNYLSDISKLMRQTLNDSDKEWISLEQEHHFIETYLKLEQVRTDYTFDYHIHFDENLEVDNTAIPPMLIQPLLENAVKYGRPSNGQKGQIEVSFSKTEYGNRTALAVTVSDNGPGLGSNSNPNHLSKGISITQNRIANAGLDYFDKQTPLWQSESGSITERSGLTVRFYLPLNEIF